MRWAAGTMAAARRLLAACSSGGGAGAGAGSRILLAVFFLAASLLASAANAAVSYDHRSLVINGRRRILISGSIHYPRSTPEVPYSYNLCLPLRSGAPLQTRSWPGAGSVSHLD